mmetsp:Transcript_17844/g.26569  ORF Transcript_17844/g.26569 Transcript_17844/m.26569 type:complete len:202 (+) Transcript_17844:643-1248(+)
MASKGKCNKCGKTVYAMECMTVGPPGKKDVYHRWCFKCQNEGCTWQLTLQNSFYYEGRVYCKNHNPMTGFSNKDHAHGTFRTDAVSVKDAMNAPKLNTVSEQIRGADAGKKTNMGLDSMSISTAQQAPKLNTVSEQVRGADAGQKSSIGLDSMSISTAQKAPKLDTVSAQVKVNFCSNCGAKAHGRFCSNCGQQLVHHTGY